MTATEKLRRMLDECGVEWWQSANTLGCIFTRWHSPLFGDEVCAMENGKEGLVLFDHFLTPEQAIAATLGAGTCEVEGYDDGIDEGMDGDWYSYAPPTWYLSCGHRYEGGERPSFCPVCGKRVVKEDA